MIIHVPDAHPGRCPNLRGHSGPNGEHEFLRCLDYAAVPHVCTFPEGTRWTVGGSFTQYRQPKPVPWVRPGDAPRSSTGDAT